MNILRSWREIKIMLKMRYSILSDDDFNFEESQRENMLDKLAVKLKKSREELEIVFAELQKF
ncbi:MAG: general stress protein CsbD [Cyclobacteriaceae bacterium]